MEPRTGLDGLARTLDEQRGDTLASDSLADARRRLDIRVGDAVRVTFGFWRGATGTVVKVGRKYVSFDVRGEGGAPSDIIDALPWHVEKVKR